ncbi:MAG: HAD family phosphatase [Ruminococcaceae bacterium]|nr:HAD family phosphatase [Oscillospiraceae bacterium]
MGKFSGVLLCSDFDGTLYHDGRISDATQEALRYFRENGGRFTLATGRYPSILDDIAEDGIHLVCNAPLVAVNGALVYDRASKNVLLTHTMEESFAPFLWELCQTVKGIESVVLVPTSPWLGEKFLPHELTEEYLTERLRGGLLKVCCWIDRAHSDEIVENIRCRCGAEWNVARSCSIYCEIHGASYDKGKTARYLAGLLGADTLICVGDYENDLSMIREADIGVAMGNAVEVLKQAADRVTARVEEDGVAQLIRSL